MKRFVFFICLSLMLAYSCGRNDKQTISDLKKAIDIEFAAQKCYSLCAKRAEQDSIYWAIALFNALEKSKEVQLNLLTESITQMGVKSYDPVATNDMRIDSTLLNLKNASKNERFKSDSLYIGFLVNAEKDNAQDVIMNLNYIKDAEKTNAQFILSVIGDSTVCSLPYYVCNKCGRVYRKLPDMVCSICQNKLGKFFLMKQFNTDTLSAIKPDTLSVK